MQSETTNQCLGVCVKCCTPVIRAGNGAFSKRCETCATVHKRARWNAYRKTRAISPEWRAVVAERQRVLRKRPGQKARERAYRPQYVRDRRATSVMFQIGSRLRSRLHNALRAGGSRKSGKLVELIDCSINDFKRHIETLFAVGMSWEARNFHIGHRRPCASFDLSDPAQQRACFHFTNLRPEWPVDNLTRGSFWGGRRWSVKKAA